MPIFCRCAAWVLCGVVCGGFWGGGFGGKHTAPCGLFFAQQAAMRTEGLLFWEYLEQKKALTDDIAACKHTKHVFAAGVRYGCGSNTDVHRFADFLPISVWVEWVAMGWGGNKKRGPKPPGGYNQPHSTQNPAPGCRTEPQHRQNGNRRRKRAANPRG